MMLATHETPAPNSARDLALRAIVGAVTDLDGVYSLPKISAIEATRPTAAKDAAYLRWRKSLLRQAKLTHMGSGDRREQYLHWRKALLDQRFPKSSDQQSDAPSNLSNALRLPLDNNKLPSRHGRRSAGSQIVRSSDFNTSRIRTGHYRSHSTSATTMAISDAKERIQLRTQADAQGLQPIKPPPTQNEELIPSTQTTPTQDATKGVSSAYEFSGMHYIFDHHKKAITAIRFAHEDKDLLAVASMDGTISLCSTFDNPSVLGVLKGHSRGVTDIDWALSNDYIVSSSLDGSVRVWDVKSRSPLRGVKNTSPCYACRFMPLNTNIFLYGTGRGAIHVINLSTGKSIEQLQLGDPILCLEFESTGKILFAGDDKGFVHVLEYNFVTGRFAVRGKHKVVISNKGITSLEYKSWFNNQRGVRTPQLIVTCLDSTVKLCGVEEGAAMAIKVQREFAIVNKVARVRTRFCPLISSESGACLVSGSEDMNIYIYNVKKKGPKSLVNKLQGHSAAVIDVSWNYEESLLASGDADGVVIIWKRVHMESKTLTRREEMPQ